MVCQETSERLVRYPRISGYTRANIDDSFYYVVFWHLVAWIYAWVIQEKYTREQPVWDWVDPGFVEGFFVLIFWGLSHLASLCHIRPTLWRF